MSATRLQWKRSFPDSSVNFDLVLTNPQELDCARVNELLNKILEETHRELTLSSRAANEFQRWFAQPNTPLKSTAIVLISNWFMTNGGDKHSTVASRCEVLWDALFPCRPEKRMSSPARGQNHVVLPAEFERFWQRLLNAQGGNEAETSRTSEVPNVDPLNATPERLLAKIDNKKGLHCEVEGSPRAIADFLQLVSGWEDRHPDDQV